MANIMSPIKEIDQLWMDKMPSGKVMKGVDVICVDNIVIVRGQRGALYHAGNNRLGKFAYVFGVWPWTDALMRCLYKLGVLTATQVREHMERAVTHDKWREARDSLAHLQRYMRRYGAELTPEQIQAIQSSGNLTAEDVSKVLETSHD